MCHLKGTHNENVGLDLLACHVIWTRVCVCCFPQSGHYNRCSKVHGYVFILFNGVWVLSKPEIGVLLACGRPGLYLVDFYKTFSAATASISVETTTPLLGCI